MYMISIKNIVKDYQAGDTIVHALRDININFRKSEFVSILGPSGCGKTTLLNIIGGLDKYTSGDIVVNGKSTKEFKDKDWDAYRSHYIGFVFQSYNLIPHLSVLENVELALTIAGTSKKERRAKAIKALNQVGLAEQIKKRPNQLSGGQMQRVAIARAIVNEPQVILADEPTGALDSETSVQVMDILKEISKKCLVIMVTHNQDLAKDYSTRIISLLDGNLIDDTNPYKNKEPKSKDNKKIKSSMGIFTAFGLSFKNLWSKKLKTFITAFAGSIGIIGIALVLSVSNGLDNYINTMQTDTLSSYPISVSMAAVDYDAITQAFATAGDNQQTEYPTDNKLNGYDLADMMVELGSFNYLSDDFRSYVAQYYEADRQKAETERDINAIKYSYATDLKLITMYNGNAIKVSTTTSIQSLSGTTSGLFSEGFADSEAVLNNYDILAGDYPTNANQLALVVDKNNSFSTLELMGMGIEFTKVDGVVQPIDFDDIVGHKTYRLVYNDNYYIYDSANDTFNINTDLQAMYDLSNSTEQTLTIACILRQKKDSTSNLLSKGIVYMPQLTAEYRENCQQSTIATKTKQNKKIYQPFVVDIAEIKQFLGSSEPLFNFDSSWTVSAMQTYVQDKFDIIMTEDEIIDLVLQSVGASDTPTGIYFYPASFEGKENILAKIDEWNASDVGAHNKIVITDSTTFLTKTLGQLIDIVSYVLIAFSAISLVVSSIMIGVITYTSVIERTKEIGVLRSVGARKKDISRVFNCETFMVGLTAGSLGVLIAWGFTFAISAIIKAVAGGAITTSMAILTWQNAVALIVISVVLTLIAGLVPALLAAKKDPVKALRSE